MTTVLLTGLPRSGTTLACELLNQVADTVALDEPMDWYQFTGTSQPREGLLVRGLGRARVLLGGQPPRRPAPPAAEICDNIEAFCRNARASLAQRGTAISRHVDGKVVGSKVADHTTASGLRARLAERAEIAFAGELSPDFLLAVKHNSGFAALLEQLIPRMPVFAIVRNPLSILSSWQTVPFPPQAGHVAMGEAFDRVLAADLAGMPDRLDRQLHILEWFFSRYSTRLGPGSVIRYEDMVASGGAALRAVTPEAGSLQVPLENRNRARSVYDDGLASVLGRRLLDSAGSWRAFYRERDVEDLLA